MCDFLGDSSEGRWGSAVIRWGLSLAATGRLPSEGEGRGGGEGGGEAPGSTAAQG